MAFSRTLRPWSLPVSGSTNLGRAPASGAPRRPRGDRGETGWVGGWGTKGRKGRLVHAVQAGGRRGGKGGGGGGGGGGGKGGEGGFDLKRLQSSIRSTLSRTSSTNLPAAGATSARPLAKPSTRAGGRAAGGGRRAAGVRRGGGPPSAIFDAIVDDVERLVHLAPAAGRLPAAGARAAVSADAPARVLRARTGRSLGRTSFAGAARCHLLAAVPRILRFATACRAAACACAPQSVIQSLQDEGPLLLVGCRSCDLVQHSARGPPRLAAQTRPAHRQLIGRGRKCNATDPAFESPQILEKF